MNTPEPELVIADNPDRARYEARLGDQIAAFSTYRLNPGRIAFLHTEVSPEFEGRGIGSRLAKAVLDDSRARGLRVLPLCPFIAAYIKRHQEYADVIAPRPPR